MRIVSLLPSATETVYAIGLGDQLAGPRLVDGVEALAAILHPDAGAAAPSGRTRRIA